MGTALSFYEGVGVQPLKKRHLGRVPKAQNPKGVEGPSHHHLPIMVGPLGGVNDRIISTCTAVQVAAGEFLKINPHRKENIERGTLTVKTAQ